DVGGLGGAALTFAPLTDSFLLGGGGGAGHGFNSAGTDGAAGGGVIFVRAAALAGAGVIDASGVAADTSGTSGAGGGGAGGTVAIQVTGSAVCNVTVHGGNGGDAGS